MGGWYPARILSLGKALKLKGETSDTERGTCHREEPFFFETNDINGLSPFYA